MNWYAKQMEKDVKDWIRRIQKEEDRFWSLYAKRKADGRI